MKIPDNVANFFYTQGFVIVSTIDSKGYPHASCKDIVEINKELGKVFILDLYRGKTHEDLRSNPHINITAVDEHKFVGFSLKGKAHAFAEKELSQELIEAWDTRITSRLTQRLLKNIHEEKGHTKHPEALLPKPEYLIEIDVEEIIDLTPHHIKQGV